jgi:hypothetical protein
VSFFLFAAVRSLHNVAKAASLGTAHIRLVLFLFGGAFAVALVSFLSWHAVPPSQGFAVAVLYPCACPSKRWDEKEKTGKP